MRDEGVGVRVMEAVRDARNWPPEVEFIDGGVGGLRLLPYIEEAHALAVFDAADMHLVAGEFRVVLENQLADEHTEHRISLHDISFLETLRLSEQFTRRPPVVRLLVIQPGVVDYGQELTSELAAAMPRLTEAGTKLVDEMISGL